MQLPQRGFTLLELLVVITLIGLIAGVVAPRFIGLGDKLTQKNQLQEVRQKVNGLPLLAMRNAATIRIDKHGAPLGLPDGWRISASSPVVYQSNGVCRGGDIEVWRSGAKHAAVSLQPPLCQWRP